MKNKFISNIYAAEISMATNLKEKLLEIGMRSIYRAIHKNQLILLFKDYSLMGIIAGDNVTLVTSAELSAIQYLCKTFLYDMGNDNTEKINSPIAITIIHKDHPDKINPENIMANIFRHANYTYNAGKTAVFVFRDGSMIKITIQNEDTAKMSSFNGDDTIKVLASLVMDKTNSEEH